MQRFYVLSAQLLDPAGARIVKFMGDGGLVVFPPESMQEMVAALAQLAREARQLARTCGLDAYLNINVHVGLVIAGRFGPPGQERFDVIGTSPQDSAGAA